ncbi:MAG: PD-(D/E)XK nuclease family protein, partial [Planctomycetales bacterium]|nr:PD-(D/E)XK nuclease family protein [Planctomycetales bacterium]
GLAAANAASGRPGGGVREARQREARWIARRIAQLVDSPEGLIPEPASAGDDEDGGQTLRPVRLGDVAILLRALSDVALYEEALRQQGIDYYLAGGHAFYAQQEVYDVLNLLRAVTSLVDEIALAGALRSPFFALTDETLYWLVKQSNSLNAALAADPPPQLAAPEAAKVRRAAATIATLRQRKDRVLAAELLDEALALTGYDAVLQAEFLGSRKLANLDKLREQARALDRTSPGDVSGFVTQLSEFVARAPKEPPAATQTEGDVVRIMTIHNAKGLEFPVVVLPDLDRPSRPGDSHATVHRELGPLVPGENRKHGLGWQLYRALEDRQERDERLRLFYVACTRAADMLILSGSRKNPEKPQSEAVKLLTRRYDVGSGAYAGEPLPSGMHPPQIRVIDAEPAPPRIPEGAAKGADLLDSLAKCVSLAGKLKQPVELPRLAQPIPRDRQARRRFSFSQLTGELERAVAEPDAGEPLPLDETAEHSLLAAIGDQSALDPRRFGTLVHDVLERVDFADASDVAAWCEFLAPVHFPGHAEVAAASAREPIERLFASARGQQLATAIELRREVEFLLPWPPVREDAAPATGRYLHGFIDCLYCDRAGEWHLLDYKTNRTTAATVSQTAAHYELQLFVYRLACEQSLGRPLAESTLLMLAPGVEHAFAWDERQSQAAIARITAAMDALCGH